MLANFGLDLQGGTNNIYQGQISLQWCSGSWKGNCRGGDLFRKGTSIGCDAMAGIVS